MAKKSLEKDIQRALDYQEIQNLVNKYEYKLGTGGRFKEVEDLFAKKTPGVRVEMTWGVYEGTEGIKRLYSGLHKSLMGDPMIPGLMLVMTNTSPIIEVAEDGETAKGLWVCLGHETHPVAGSKPQAFWTYARRAFDFAKEDGKWKIWHYQVYGGFCAPYETGWVDGPDMPTFPIPNEFKPDGPPTQPHNGMYKPNAVVEYYPLPPEPYATWEETFSY